MPQIKHHPRAGLIFTLFAFLVCATIKCHASPDEGMIHLSGGTFQMGCGDECPMDDAKPVHTVVLDSFWIDATPVTNRQFNEFVSKTKYKTVAEKKPKAEDYPDAPKENLKAGSAVFTPQDVNLENPYAWWSFTPGAYWRKPEGPKSFDAVRDKADYPVVHVTYDDALHYCRWAAKDLPTEAQYEYAARGGLIRKKFAWGDELKPGSKWQANIWQGVFPSKNTAEDGYVGLSPVKAFSPNSFGLYDVAGNVWQWCKDWYRPDTYAEQVKSKQNIKNPQGPRSGSDPSEEGIAKRVQRGGSYLCSEQYCVRYLVGSRGRGSPDSSASNLGFRCVKNLR
jgi:formylglycine-generating enzyme